MDLDGLAAAVDDLPGLMAIQKVTREEALAEYRVMFADEPDMLALAEADPTLVPASLRLFVDFPHLDAAAERLAVLPEVLGTEGWDEELVYLAADRIFQEIQSGVTLGLFLQRIQELECTSSQVSDDGAAFEVTPPGPAAAVVLEALRIGFAG